jgi:hypothetical protein
LKEAAEQKTLEETEAARKKALEGTDENAQERAGSNIAQAKNIKNNINKLEPELRNLVPILKKPINSTNKRREGEIDGITTKIENTLNDATTGLIANITKKIGDGTTSIIGGITTVTATG